MRPGLAIAIWGLLLAAAAPASTQERSLEYPVKAAFLAQFGSFVEWPAESFPESRAPVQICVVGRDPFGAALDQVVRGQTLKGRPILVRRLPVATRASGCEIAYIGGSPDQPVAVAAHVFAGEPVLTVSDVEAAGVIVQFAVRANRVRFRIDQRHAATNRLRISSKLLNLALEVVP
jgi:hypothetical protein